MSVLWSHDSAGGFLHKPPCDEFDRIVATQLLDVEWIGNQIIKLYEATPEDLIWSEDREKSTSLAVGVGRDVMELCRINAHKIAEAIGKSIFRGGSVRSR